MQVSLELDEEDILERRGEAGAAADAGEVQAGAAEALEDVGQGSRAGGEGQGEGGEGSGGRVYGVDVFAVWRRALTLTLATPPPQQLLHNPILPTAPKPAPQHEKPRRVILPILDIPREHLQPHQLRGGSARDSGAGARGVGEGELGGAGGGAHVDGLDVLGEALLQEEAALAEGLGVAVDAFDVGEL